MSLDSFGTFQTLVLALETTRGDRYFWRQVYRNTITLVGTKSEMTYLVIFEFKVGNAAQELSQKAPVLILCYLFKSFHAESKKFFIQALLLLLLLELLLLLLLPKMLQPQKQR